MRLSRFLFCTWIALAGWNTGMAQADLDEPVLLETKQDSLNYMFGVMMAKNIGDNTFKPYELDSELILKGFRDQVRDESLSGAEAAEAYVRNFMEQRYSTSGSNTGGASTEELQQLEQEYLAKMADDPRYIRTESGLMYEVIKMGSGPIPGPNSKVKAHYKGTLTDGTEFDSSYSRDQPFEAPLTAVIPGWTEGLQLMPVGSTFRFVIPSKLAYGPRGMGNIPAHSTLIFEVELLDILK